MHGAWWKLHKGCCLHLIFFHLITALADLCLLLRGVCQFLQLSWMAGSTAAAQTLAAGGTHMHESLLPRFKASHEHSLAL